MRRRSRSTVRSHDPAATGLGAFLFSTALGLASVVLPLLAIHEGYSVVEVGVLTAVSGMSQLLSRLALGAALRRFPDWTFIFAAAFVLALSNAVLVISAALAPFVAAQVLQGISRACFWTGSQTHVVQAAKTSVRGLAWMNLVAGLGLLLGPLLGGALAAQSPESALAVGAGVALVACVPPLFLERFPPFVIPLDRPTGAMWRRPGVSSGCWSGMTAGAWHGLMVSYVPVLLSQAGHSSTIIGGLVAATNASSLVGSTIVARIRQTSIARAFVIGTVLAGGCTVLTALTAGATAWAASFLILSGLGVGALQTIGPAIASDSVALEERGEAIAVAGTFRAAAQLFSPLGIAGLLVVTPLGAAMALTGVLIAVPALTGRRLGRHLASVSASDP